MHTDIANIKTELKQTINLSQETGFEDGKVWGKHRVNQLIAKMDPILKNYQ